MGYETKIIPQYPPAGTATTKVTIATMVGNPGPQGPTGSRWREGSGPPDDSLGDNFDFYHNRDNGDVYQKEGGTYGTPYANITGPQGPQGDTGPQGYKGWSPIVAIVTDGARRVLQVVNWTDGAGTKPATGDYIGATGLVSAIADAVDIRGPQGIGVPDPTGVAQGRIPETDGADSYQTVVNGPHHYKKKWFGQGVADYAQKNIKGGSTVVGKGALIPVNRSVLLDAFAIDVLSAGEAGAVARFIIYQMKPDSFRLTTASLLYDGTGSEVSVDSIGVKQLILPSPIAAKPPGIFCMIQTRDDYSPEPQVRYQNTVRGYSQGDIHGGVDSNRFDRPGGADLRNSGSRFDGFSSPSDPILLTWSGTTECVVILARVHDDT